MTKHNLRYFYIEKLRKLFFFLDRREQYYAGIIYLKAHPMSKLSKIVFFVQNFKHYAKRCKKFEIRQNLQIMLFLHNSHNPRGPANYIFCTKDLQICTKFPQSIYGKDRFWNPHSQNTPIIHLDFIIVDNHNKHNSVECRTSLQTT